MNSKSTKALVAVTILVASAALAIGLILIQRHRATKVPLDELKSAQDHLAFKPHQVDKPKIYQTPAQAKNQSSIHSTARHAQPSDLKERESRTSGQGEFLEKAQASLRTEIQTALAETLEDEFPELNLTENELAWLTDTVITIRETMQDLSAMERSGDNVAAVKKLQERRDQAIWDFERITGISALSFMLRASAEGGIDSN